VALGVDPQAVVGEMPPVAALVQAPFLYTRDVTCRYVDVTAPTVSPYPPDAGVRAVPIANAHPGFSAWTRHHKVKRLAVLIPDRQHQGR
jgi:hypothetical protein